MTESDAVPDRGRRLRVIIADEDPRARRVVRDALQESGVVVIAEAGDGHEAVELTLHYRPDVVLMDVLLPGLDGIDATARILERIPEMVVVMLAADDDAEVGMQCLRRGAAGFLPKTVAVAALPRALRAASQGEAVISRELATRMVGDIRRTPLDGVGIRPVRSPLTSREWEILDLLCQDLGTDQIAEVLVLSPETVRSHVKNILRKLGVRSRRQAVDAARRLRTGVSGESIVA